MSESANLNSCGQASNNSDGAWDLPPSRLLVVDDTETSRRLLSLCLKRAGANVVEAENGRQAVELAVQLEPDLILMDMRMPEMDGFEATRQLRESGCRADIIALTGDTICESEQRCLSAGCNAYVAKPIVMDQLMQMLAQRLRAKVHQPEDHKDYPAQSSQTADLQTSCQTEQSSTATDDREFIEIADKFLQRLGGRLHEMREAVKHMDYARLIELAHWLKGAGGSVGFDPVSQAAASLEDCARAGNAVGVERFVKEIEDIHSRIKQMHA